MRASQRAHTLIEVLIASALYLLVLILVGQLAVVGMRTRSQTEDKNEAYRSATICMDSLNRDLIHTSLVYCPTWNSWPLNTDVTPGSGSLPLVVRCLSTRSAAPEAVVGYRYDATQKTLTRLVYDPGFDPASPPTQTLRQPAKVLARWVKDFKVRRLDPNSFYGVSLLRTQIMISTTQPGQPGPVLEISTDSGLRL